MLTKIKLKNFMSFRNETIIDVKATNYKFLSETNVYNGVLKGLLFVGANASGKTNAIKSILFLFMMLFSNENFNTTPFFCFFSSSDEMELEYTFNINNDQIVYGFSLTREGVVNKEYLEVNNRKMFYRIRTNAESKVTKRKNYDEQDIDNKTLFIRNIYFNTKFQGYPSLNKWFDFLSNSVYFNSVERNIVSNNKLLDTTKYIEEYGVDKINKFFKFFGFNQEIRYENKYQTSKDLLAIIKDRKEIFLKKNNIDIWIPLFCESLGNQTLLNMLPVIFHTLENECILVIDEFSSAFHNELEELIVRYFMTNSKSSQLFIVSHSTNLLSNILLRPDQIYSINFDDEKGSLLKRFSSEGPRESQNLEKMYLSGVFNGLPNYKNTPNSSK